MEFDLTTGMAVLERTPSVLRALLGGLPDAWLRATEGPGTWSAYDILGHLIHGDRTNWMPRVEHLLRHGQSVAFPAFERESMLREPTGEPVLARLETFAAVRAGSLARLSAMQLTPNDLDRRGLHPELGVVELRQHLATWTAHDLSHIAQIVRVMARQYGDAVGPWKAYLPLVSAVTRS